MSKKFTQNYDKHYACVTLHLIRKGMFGIKKDCMSKKFTQNYDKHYACVTLHIIGKKLLGEKNINGGVSQ
jgi:hypothetical protein